MMKDEKCPNEAQTIEAERECCLIKSRGCQCQHMSHSEEFGRL